MSIDNVTRNPSARHCVSRLSADLESLLQFLAGVLDFPPPNTVFCVRIICHNDVAVGVVLGVFTMCHVMGRGTGHFLCMYSGNTSGIKMALAKARLFLSLCCGEK